MIKNPTPRIIAFLTATILTCVVSVISLIFQSKWLEVSISSALTFAISYLLTLYALEFFIYRKIKLIYKSIHQLKTKKSDPLLPPLFGIIEDPISEVTKDVLKWAEDQTVEIEQLKKNEEFRKEFLGNVSHELKTPIFNIQGYIHTLLEGAMDDPDINIHFLTKAAKSTDRIAALVEDLESISQLESGYLTMEMETFDIHDLTKDIFDSLEFMAREKQIEFGFKAGADAPFIVEADKSRIRQVLVNLISNSIKYGNTGGRTLLGLYDMDENILIEVSDNGIGIEAEHIPRLFERFFRVDRSRSRSGGGTGLGLAIVKHIIEAHNQTINVRSSPGIGTTFGFTLKKA
ncbi:sensor histidine kinase [Solitalea koreensis]|uniref:histidine kinase n=1 Tax=Solitalea koreensis TaxID=543615 RepID=A0A521BH85_9SPHI|nr:ATP-binding protein [Solitalea koreensis]SMO46494.1 two-component system, OmpR family, phosphate regulon sensor histidine kinase PhoR [Solitalea koreensis]